MTIKSGDRVPNAALLRIGIDGPEPVVLADCLSARKVVIFGLPGAFTGTCTAAHVPSFIRTHQALVDAGVDEVICVAVNDPHVMHAWGIATGAAEAGISMLGDPAAEYTKAMGLAFTAPAAGFYDRTMRHALFAEDGVIRVLSIEQARGVCESTSGEAMLAEIMKLT